MLVLCSKHHLNLKQCKAIPEVCVWGGGGILLPSHCGDEHMGGVVMK